MMLTGLRRPHSHGNGVKSHNGGLISFDGRIHQIYLPILYLAFALNYCAWRLIEIFCMSTQVIIGAESLDHSWPWLSNLRF